MNAAIKIRNRPSSDSSQRPHRRRLRKLFRKSSRHGKPWIKSDTSRMCFDIITRRLETLGKEKFYRTISQISRTISDALCIMGDSIPDDTQRHHYHILSEASHIQEQNQRICLYQRQRRSRNRTFVKTEEAARKVKSLPRLGVARGGIYTTVSFDTPVEQSEINLTIEKSFSRSSRFAERPFLISGNRFDPQYRISSKRNVGLFHLGWYRSGTNGRKSRLRLILCGKHETVKFWSKRDPVFW